MRKDWTRVLVGTLVGVLFGLWISIELVGAKLFGRFIGAVTGGGVILLWFWVFYRFVRPKLSPNASGIWRLLWSQESGYDAQLAAQATTVTQQQVVSRSKRLVWLLPLLAVAVSLIAGFFTLQQPLKQADQAVQPTPNPSLSDLEKQAETLNKSSTSERMQFLKSFLVGKMFYNNCASGEWGTFEKDGGLPINFNRDFMLNDTRPNSKVGRWSFKGDSLVISGTTLSDGPYDEFGFNGSYRSLIAVVPNEGCGVTVGANLETLQQYQKDNTPK